MLESSIAAGKLEESIFRKLREGLVIKQVTLDPDWDGEDEERLRFIVLSAFPRKRRKTKDQEESA